VKRTRTAIVHYTAPPVIGGVEHVIQAHVQVLRQAGYPVTVIAGRGDRTNLSPDADLLLIPKLDSQHPQIMETSTMLERGQQPPEFDDLVKWLIENLTVALDPFENVIVHNIFTKHFNLPLTAALHTMLDAGVIRNYIAWCHDFTWTSPSSSSKVHPGHPWDLLRTYRSDVTYVTVSRHRQQELAALLSCSPEQIHVVYNGIDPKTLLGLSEEGHLLISRLNILESDLVMLMPVRVTKAKNIELALHVTATLKAKGIGVKLIVTGPPDPHDPQNMTYFRFLKALRSQLEVEQEVRFVFESGPDPDQPFTVDTSVVGDLFRASDLMFMPSHREGFGMPVLEAGLIGLPVVCTSVPAAEEIAGVDSLRFDATESPAAVARLILDWARMSPIHSLRRRVRQNYSWRRIFERDIRPLLLDGRDG
jgi:glycosyltransferase involved in cell wall biosynthesis